MSVSCFSIFFLILFYDQETVYKIDKFLCDKSQLEINTEQEKYQRILT